MKLDTGCCAEVSEVYKNIKKNVRYGTADDVIEIYFDPQIYVPLGVENF